MDKLVIDGGVPLQGRVHISGAKNAALPILIATLLAPGEHRLANVPELVDVSFTLSLLGRLGCPSLLQNGGAGQQVRLDTSRIAFNEAPYDVVRKMRASVLVLGPLLARCGEAHVSLPGGCAIGVRPIDQHLKGLEALGCTFELEGGVVHGSAPKGLRGANINLDVPTVTGTENIMMAAALAEGQTVIRGAAREPEIVALADFINTLGATVEGAGSDIITIVGAKELTPSPTPFSIVPDRIEAGTYLIAGAITGGDVEVVGARPEHLGALLEALEQAGASLTPTPDGMRVQRTGPLRPVDVCTAPYPGFPTDMQAQWMALMAIAQGKTEISETIFENRFMHAAELMRLGARIETEPHSARIDGVAELHGATVMATDLRASASLVLAGLVAQGRTELLRIYHLDRGYEKLEEKLRGLGARIVRVPDDVRLPETVVHTNRQAV